jgi:hypothetical protein
VLEPAGPPERRGCARAGIVERRAMILRNKFKDMFRILILEC